MNLRIYSVKAENQENLAGGLGFRREQCWGYASISVNTPRKANFETHLPCKSCFNFT